MDQENRSPNESSFNTQNQSTKNFKKITLVQREKLKEIDVNKLKNNLHHKTHLQILNHCATKIQLAFRKFLKEKKRYGNKFNNVKGKK